MISPDVLLILILCFWSVWIICWLFVCESSVNVRSGVPIPSPNRVKFSMLFMGFVKRNARAKNVAMNAGLQGMIMAPKKNPKL